MFPTRRVCGRAVVASIVLVLLLAAPAVGQQAAGSTTVAEGMQLIVK